MSRKKQIDVILKVPRGTVNDCFGYCISCPQTKMTMRQTQDADVFYHACNLPPCHTVTIAKFREKK